MRYPPLGLARSLALLDCVGEKKPGQKVEAGDQRKYERNALSSLPLLSDSLSPAARISLNHDTSSLPHPLSLNYCQFLTGYQPRALSFQAACPDRAGLTLLTCRKFNAQSR